MIDGIDTDISILNLSTFQIEVWNIIHSMLKQVADGELADRSYVDLRFGDILLDFPKKDIVLYFKIDEVFFDLNFLFFDIIIFNNEDIEIISQLYSAIFLGRYNVVTLCNNKKEKIKVELIFDNPVLEKYNTYWKDRCFIQRKAIYSKTTKGAILVNQK